MTANLIGWGIAIFLVVATILAFLSRQGRAAGMSDYFLGNRKLGGAVSALSYSATTYSAFMMVGLAGLTYRGGVGALGFEIIYFAGVSLVAIFGPMFWRTGKKYGYITPAHMLGHRYDNKAVAVVIALSSCLFLIPYSAVQLTGIGYLLEGMSDGAIGYTTGVIIATVTAIVFSSIAGIRSVVWTDSLQALMMIVASTAVALLVITKLGGFTAMMEQAESNQPGSLSVPGPGLFSLTTFLALTIPWMFFSISNPQVSQRLFMPSSVSALRRMLIGFLVFGFIYTLVSVVWGYAALAAFPGLENADKATPRLLSSDLVPPVLGVVVMVGIVAAAISTIDSILLTLSSTFACDVYGNASKAGDYGQLKVGKIVIPVIAVLAFAFAQLQLDLIAVLSVASSAALVVMVPSIIGAFYWKRGTAAGVLVSVILTGAAVVVCQLTGYMPFGIPSGIWGIFVATALYVGVSLMTTAPSERAEEFVRVARTPRTQESLGDDAEEVGDESPATT